MLPDYIDGGVKPIKSNNVEGFQRELQTSITAEGAKELCLSLSPILFFNPPLDL